MKILNNFVFAFFVVSSVTESFAQAPSLVSHIPASNSHSTLPNSTVKLTFSQNMSAQAANAAAIRVVSEWRGQLTGTYTGVGTATITFTPAQPFLLSEHICVTVTAKTTSQAGVAVNHTTAYKYSITDGNGSGLFANANDIAVAYKVRDLAIADMNGDGKRDVVTANSSSANAGTVNVRLGNGQGGFSSSRDIAWSAIPTAIILGDINNDGKIDIATANSGNNSVSIRLADGANGFASTPDVAVGQAPLKIALQDVNRDNNLDLLTVSASTNAVSLRLGNGKGGFTAPTSPLRAEIPVGTNPFDLATKDINGDGYPDLVTVARTSTSGTVSVRLGDGAGGFTGTSVVSAGTKPFGMAVQDMNNDGKADLLLSYGAGGGGSRGTVSVRLGDGAGTFSGGTLSEVSHGPGRIVTGDFNADGKLDFATISWDGFSFPAAVSVRFGDGLGGFSGVLEWPIGKVPVDVDTPLAVADMTGDGVPDLITACNPYIEPNKGYDLNTMYLSIRTGKSGQNFEGHMQVASGQGEHFDANNGITSDINDAVLADVNQDQKLDLLLSQISSNNVGVKLNNGAGGFVALPDVMLPAASYNRTIAAGDINNDGFMDFVTANAGSRMPVSGMTASVRLGNGKGSFTGNTEIALGGNPYQIYLQDVNNDGYLDLLSTIYYSPAIVVKLGNGLGGFSTGSTLIGAGNQVSLEIVDLNNDGFLDIVGVDTESGATYRFIGNGSGSFTSGTVIAKSGAAVGSASGDVNGDGNVDVVIASTLGNGLPGPLTTYLGSGTGNFSSVKTNTTINPYNNELRLVDLDGDGILDAVLGSIYSSLTTYSGTGTGAFTYKTTIPVSEYVTRIMSCDINDDGAVDLLSTAWTYGNVSVRLNGTQHIPLATVAAAPNSILGAAPLVVVPNPAHNTVQVLNSIIGSEIYLLDALGRKIRSYKTSSLDISGVAPGLYFLQNDNKVTRLVIE